MTKAYENDLREVAAVAEAYGTSTEQDMVEAMCLVESQAWEIARLAAENARLAAELAALSKSAMDADLHCWGPGKLIERLRAWAPRELSCPQWLRDARAVSMMNEAADALTRLVAAMNAAEEVLAMHGASEHGGGRRARAQGGEENGL